MVFLRVYWSCPLFLFYLLLSFLCLYGFLASPHLGRDETLYYCVVEVGRILALYIHRGTRMQHSGI